MLVNIPSPPKPFVESLNYLATKSYIIIMMMSSVFGHNFNIIKTKHRQKVRNFSHNFFCVKNEVKLRQFLCH